MTRVCGPAAPWRDSNDQIIEPGDLVAFNYSGAVLAGVVYYVPERRNVGKVQIDHADLNGYVRVGVGVARRSKLANGRSIMVLKKAADL